MVIISTIIALILALIGGGTPATIPAQTENYTAHTPATDHTPANDTEHKLMDGAYNIKETRDADRVTIDYNIINSQGDTCNISTVYYDNGAAASSQQC